MVGSRSKIHITYLTDAHLYGGAEQYLALLTKEIDRTQFDLTVVCSQAKAMDRLAARLKEQRVHTVRVPIRSVLQYPTAFILPALNWSETRRLAAVIEKLKPDILHINQAGSDSCQSSIVAAHLAGWRTIISTKHLCYSYRSLHARAAPIRDLWLALLDRSLRMVIAPSEASKRVLVGDLALPEARCMVIRYGIDVQTFSPPSMATRRSLKEMLGLDGRATVVGTVGQLSKRKGQRSLLQSAREVSAVEPQARFLLIGGGEDRDLLEKESQALGLESRIVFTGYRDDIPHLLKAVDIFVLPSLAEGMPLSILEAMATGLPVVATTVGGIPETVVDGETGFLVPPGDVHGLTRAILELIGDRNGAREMGMKGYQRVRAHFSAGSMARRVEDLYGQLLGEHRT